jgi:hypothetical protein
MKLALSGLFVLGLATLAGAQASAPTLSIETKGIEQAANGVATFRGLKMTANGVEIRADEATPTGNGGELVLRGNVTVVLPQGWTARVKTF